MEVMSTLNQVLQSKGLMWEIGYYDFETETCKT